MQEQELIGHFVKVNCASITTQSATFTRGQTFKVVGKNCAAVKHQLENKQVTLAEPPSPAAPEAPASDANALTNELDGEDGTQFHDDTPQDDLGAFRSGG